LIEYGHQNQRHDHPNSDTLKQIVQSYSLNQRTIATMRPLDYVWPDYSRAPL
jgi:hypothetical protein